MSIPHLPEELLDHVVDFLHYKEDALVSCCLISKSWIPRVRKHLFADVWFESGDLEVWKKMFPDPSTSPGRYTKTLTIKCPHAVTVADAEVGGWIRGFSHVMRLRLGSSGWDPETYDDATFLIPLRGLSPFVKSLSIDRVGFPSSRIFDLILSFPLLEDLTMTHRGYARIDHDDVFNGLPTLVQRSNQPALTGSLKLVALGTEPIARRLLSTPGGIHFRKFTLAWEHGEDIPLTTALVGGCSHTLESLDITCDPPIGSATMDLSKATKLRDVVFQPKSSSVKWITMALQTTTPKHQELQKILIRFPYSLLFPYEVKAIKRSTTYAEWLDLDRLLVQLWETRSAGLKVTCTAWPGRKGEVRDFTNCFFPELTRRGAIDVR